MFWLGIGLDIIRSCCCCAWLLSYSSALFVSLFGLSSRSLCASSSGLLDLLGAVLVLWGGGGGGGRWGRCCCCCSAALTGLVMAIR